MPEKAGPSPESIAAAVHPAQNKFCVSRCVAIVNKDSGRVQKLGEDQIRAMLETAFGNRLQALYFLKGDEITPALEEILDHPSAPAVILGGGDGTVRACGHLFINKDIHMGVLPLGTMNLLAHDLGIPDKFEDALEAYQHCQTMRIDAGIVNEHIFLCNAVIGVVPEAGLAREEARRAHSFQESLLSWSAVLATVFDGLHKSHRRRFFVTSEKKRRAFFSNALIIANNGYVQNPDRPQQRLSRNSLTDGKLVIYSAGPDSRLASLRLLWRLLWGSWQKDASIYTFEAREALIDDLNAQSLVSLDGEPIELDEPFFFKILPEALPVMVPVPQTAEGS